MSKVNEAREALEIVLDEGPGPRELPSVWENRVKGHVEACHYEEFVDEEWQECGQEGALCERGKQLEEAMKP